MEANAVQSNATNQQWEAIQGPDKASIRNQYREQNFSLLYPDGGSKFNGSNSTRSIPSSNLPTTGG